MTATKPKCDVCNDTGKDSTGLFKCRCQKKKEE